MKSAQQLKNKKGYYYRKWKEKYKLGVKRFLSHLDKE